MFETAALATPEHGLLWITNMGCAGGVELTQFQLMEDSAPATQTQKAVTDAITKNTLSMIGYAPHCTSRVLHNLLDLHAENNALFLSR